MPRHRNRVCLQAGLKLDLNRLRRQRFVRPGMQTGPNSIRWSYTYTDEEIASGSLSASMENEHDGWLRIQIGQLDQWIPLHRRARHFGGGQWYFECVRTGRLCSTVWMPPGARSFASRQAWGRQVAYSSQFQTWYDRALTQGQGLRSKLGGPEWAGYCGDDPPKPKWMRWRTYNRILERSYRYEEIADQRLISFAARFLKLR
jgi:hypothetical protein